MAGVAGMASVRAGRSTMTENMKEAEYVKITEETTEGTATETVTEEKVVVSGR